MVQFSSITIDGITDVEDQFSSQGEDYPWLLLDLGVEFLYKVSV